MQQRLRKRRQLSQRSEKALPVKDRSVSARRQLSQRSEKAVTAARPVRAEPMSWPRRDRTFDLQNQNLAFYQLNYWPWYVPSRYRPLDCFGAQCGDGAEKARWAGRIHIDFVREW